MFDGQSTPLSKISITAPRIIVAAVLLLAGAYVVYASWPSSGRLQPTLMCANQTCQKTWVATLQPGDMIPVTCSKCGQSSGVPAFKCAGCGAFNIWNETRGLPPPTQCSKCGKEAQHDHH